MPISVLSLRCSLHVAPGDKQADLGDLVTNRNINLLMTSMKVYNSR